MHSGREDSVLQQGPGPVHHPLGVGQDHSLVLTGTEGDLHGQDIGVLRVEEALLLQDTEEVQQLGGVVGAVGIAEAGMQVAVPSQPSFTTALPKWKWVI